MIIGRLAVVLAFLCLFFVPDGRAGEFVITATAYVLEDLSPTHQRLLLTAEATYEGSVDPNDQHWFIETFARVPAGNLFERTGNGKSGAGVMEDQVVTCGINCGPDVAVPKCNPQGYSTTFRGRALTGIFHQFSPETDSDLMDPSSTVCWHSCPDDGEDHEIPDDPDAWPPFY